MFLLLPSQSVLEGINFLFLNLFQSLDVVLVLFGLLVVLVYSVDV